MNVLVACEESQRVCTEFRKRGHNAFSCDIMNCSGGHPEWHIQCNVLAIIDGFCSFITCDNKLHQVYEWDMIIAFPPCINLCVSGARWFKEKIADGRQQESIDFFLKFTQLSCSKVAIENPIGVMSRYYRKPDQIIQPWQFGHGETKATCLWLKGLSLLTPTCIVEEREQRVWKMSPGKERSKLRSKTFLGIAKAMAEQWG